MQERCSGLFVVHRTLHVPLSVIDCLHMEKGNEMKHIHRIDSAFTVLQPDLSAVPVTVTPEIYANLDRDFDGFRSRWLLSRYRFDAAWPTWERHPAGDEIVYLLSGDTLLLLDTEEGEITMHLSEPGSYVIIPRNTWHTARPNAPTEMLFITPGEGTENRPV